MPSRAYYEELWLRLPADLAPAHARLRERLLLERVAPLVASCSDRSLRALDLGCGEGHFARLLAKAGAEVLAADVAAEPLRRAQAGQPTAQTCLVEPDGPLPFEDSRFDVLWAGEVIEHVADTAAWLSEVRRVLRSGGTLLLSTPDHGRLSMLAMALRPKRFDARFDPRADHLRFYTRRTLAGLLADFGFVDVEVLPAGGVPGARAVLFGCARRRRF